MRDEEVRWHHKADGAVTRCITSIGSRCPPRRGESRAKDGLEAGVRLDEGAH